MDMSTRYTILSFSSNNKKYRKIFNIFGPSFNYECNNYPNLQCVLHFLFSIYF